jgi:hypothetical protein
VGPAMMWLYALAFLIFYGYGAYRFGTWLGKRLSQQSLPAEDESGEGGRL